METTSATPRRRRSLTAFAAVSLFTCALTIIAPGQADARTTPPPESSPPVVRVASTTFTISGGGWGHGVGLSQYGARGYAANGWSATSILTRYYTGTTVGGGAPAQNLRVNIGTSSTFTVTAAGPTPISAGGTVLHTLAPGTTATIARSGGGATTVSTPGGSWRVSQPVEVDPRGTPARVNPPNQRFNRGTLSFRPAATGDLFAVVGGLDMQSYLYGLGEVPSSWPAEALKAQAIAARTYATHVINGYGSGRAAREFDLFASTIHQAYIGFEKEGGALGSAWTAAVDATNNQMVLLNNAPILALFSSSSGGHTENSEYVFVSNLPYLRGVEDPFDNSGGNVFGTWTRTFSGDWLGSVFGVGTVTSINVGGNVGVSGRVDRATVTVTGTTGSRSMTGAAFRTAINNAAAPADNLRSSRFTITGGAAAPAGRAPTGAIDVVRANGRNVLVNGWMADQDDLSRPVNIEVVLSSPKGTVRRSLAADAHRPDVAASLGGGTSARGFSSELTAPASGTYQVCINATDLPAGNMTTVVCRQVTVK